jgi:hypothetical protein
MCRSERDRFLCKLDGRLTSPSFAPVVKNRSGSSGEAIDLAIEPIAFKTTYQFGKAYYARRSLLTALTRTRSCGMHTMLSTLPSLLIPVRQTMPVHVETGNEHRPLKSAAVAALIQGSRCAV